MDEKYTVDKKKFFKAATASGVLILLFYVLPYIFAILVGLANKIFSVNFVQLYENLNLSAEADLFMDGIYQLIILLLSVFIVTRFYKFKPLSLLRKNGLADDSIKKEYEYAVNNTLLDETNIKKTKIHSKISWSKILLIGIPIMYAANMICSLLVMIITKIANNAGFTIPDVTLTLTSNDPLNVILFLVRLCVLAPLIEEFLMRGCMLKILKPFGNWFAIIITSVMFGLLHNNIGQGIGAIAIGILYGIIAVKTESIYPTIVLHGINNLFASVGSILSGDFGNKTAYIIYALILFLLAIAGLVLFIIYVGRINLKNENKSCLKTGECVRRYILNPVVLLYTVANLFIFIFLFFIEN